MADFKMTKFDRYTIDLGAIDYESSDQEELAISVPVILWAVDPFVGSVEVYATYSVDGFQVFSERPTADEILSGSDKTIWYDCDQTDFDGWEPIAYTLCGIWLLWTNHAYDFGSINVEVALSE